MENPFNLTNSGDLYIKDGDIVIENGDIKSHDLVKTNIDLYYFLAEKQLKVAIENSESYAIKIKELPKHLVPFWEKDLIDFMQQNIVPVLIFSALSIEALINFYGVSRLSGNVFRKLERRSTLDKFKKFPKLALGLTSSPMTNDIAKHIDSVFKHRDSLVHFKTKLMSYENMEEKLLSIEDATKAFQSIKIVCDYLCKIDQEFNFTFEKNIADIKKHESFDVPDFKEMYPFFKFE